MKEQKPATPKLGLTAKPLRTLSVSDIAKVAGGRATACPLPSSRSPCY